MPSPASRGLTISKLLTQILGGEIAVESTPGRGSVFRVRLLLSEAAAGQAALVAERRITGYSGARRRILIADDDFDHVELLNDILTPLGFILFTAMDGKTGLTLAEDSEPELAILDIAMPGMSGLDLAAALRARFGDKLRILIVSGNFHDAPRMQSGEFEEQTIVQYPYDAFLAKPTDVRALLEIIQKLLGLSWVYDATPAALLVVPDDPQTMIRPSLHHLSDLLQLGRIGYVRGIEAKLDEITEVQPETSEFAAYLRELVRGFELTRYMTYLENLPELSGGD